MPKKTRAQLQAENQVLRRHRMGESIVSVVNNLIRWGGLVAIAYIGFLCVETLAGETTIADIGLGFLADLKFSKGVAILFGGGGIAYGARQRALRKKTVERLEGRVKKLEQGRDSKRTTSGLTPKGNTNPRDK